MRKESYHWWQDAFELLFQLAGKRKGVQKVLHVSKMIRLHGHSWGTLICLRPQYAGGDKEVFCPHINSSCLCLKSERELEYRFSVKHFLLFMWCFCVYVLSSRRRTEEHSHLPRLNLIKSTCEGLCSTHIFYLESAGCCCTIHQSSTTSRSAVYAQELSWQEDRCVQQYMWVHVTFP